MSHTPGPWTVKGTRVVSAPYSGESFGCGGTYVALSIGNEFDAHLIAAAPDLLDALKLFLETFDDTMSLPAVVLQEKVYNAARAAIAKAEPTPPGRAELISDPTQPMEAKS